MFINVEGAPYASSIDFSTFRLLHCCTGPSAGPADPQTRRLSLRLSLCLSDSMAFYEELKSTMRMANISVTSQQDRGTVHS
jgi:hypothetical protein